MKRPPPEKKPAPRQERSAPKAQPQPQAKKPPQKPAQSAKPPEQTFIPEFLRRPSQNAPKPPAEPSGRLGLDDKKRTNDSQLNERDQLKMPWERNTASKGKEPPWKRDRGEDRKRSFLDKTRGGKSRNPER